MAVNQRAHGIARRKGRGMRALFCVLVGLFAAVCLFPFLLMITSSFMNENEIVTEGYKLIPRQWTLNAYRFLFMSPQKLIDAYRVTIFITVAGTSAGLFLMSMAGYVLNRKDFRYRNAFSFFFYFTTLFSAGLVPSYILTVQYLKLKDTIWVLLLPGLMGTWSIFLMRNFLRSIPDSLYESATIDGAGDFRIYWQVFMPLAIPSLATVGLFTALGYWNEWYNGMLYLSVAKLYPLQLYLQKLVNQTNVQSLVNQGLSIDTSQLPTQAIKMAVAVIATGPVILFYPFVQRYFIAGLTVGSVKG